MHVSRMHCEVAWDGLRATVKDNGSAAGTHVNGQRVSTAELRAGDVLRVGETELRFEGGVADEATLPPGAMVKPLAAPKPGTAPVSSVPTRAAPTPAAPPAPPAVTKAPAAPAATKAAPAIPPAAAPPAAASPVPASGGDIMLAKALEGNISQEVTESGELVGNIYYMSPERTLSSGEVDGRSDLYSLGATLYHLLTGRLPYQGKDFVEIITKIRGAALEPPRKHNPAVPEAVEKVILKTMAKKPEDRYQSAKELLAEMQKVGKALGLK